MSHFRKEVEAIWQAILDVAKKRLKQLSNHKYKLIIAIIIIGPILLYLGHKLIEKIRSHNKPKIKLEPSLSPRGADNEDLPTTELVRTDGNQIIQSTSFMNKPFKSNIGSSSFCSYIAKKIPKWKEYLVFGWVHHMEQSLNLRDIPLGIIHCALLYSKEEDYFRETDDRFQLLNHQRTIKKLDKNGHRGIQTANKTMKDWYNNIKNINSAIWEIQIDKITTKMLIAFIDENSGRYLFDIILRSKRSSKQEFGHHLNISDYDEFVDDGDVLTLIWNIKKLGVKYQINDGELIDIECRFYQNYEVKLGVNLHGKGDCVSIIDFYTERGKRQMVDTFSNDTHIDFNFDEQQQNDEEHVLVCSDSD